MQLSSQEQNLLENVNKITVLLGKGQFIEAMTEYLDDDVHLYEGNSAPKVGKEHCLLEEKKLLDTVTDFHGYNVLSGPAVKGDTTFYEAVMEFTTDDGVRHKFEQVVRTKWKGGLIIDERYYHA